MHPQGSMDGIRRSLFVTPHFWSNFALHILGRRQIQIYFPQHTLETNEESHKTYKNLWTTKEQKSYEQNKVRAPVF